jgi:carbon-monoxide dehydrogenase iron sulfur subunit
MEKEAKVMQDRKEVAVPSPGAAMNPAGQAKGWGLRDYPYPAGAAYIEADEMKCTGCGICQMACSMQHFGRLNKELSCIQIRKYLLPLPKAVQVTCVQCPEGERECEAACPLKPAAIHYDKNTRHMVVDKDRCMGDKCLRCKKACPADAIRAYPAAGKIPFLCDLCDVKNTGARDPQCINICPCGALNYVQAADSRFAYQYNDVFRIHADQKAEFIARRLYPLKKESMWRPAESAESPKGDGR